MFLDASQPFVISFQEKFGFCPVKRTGLCSEKIDESVGRSAALKLVLRSIIIFILPLACAKQTGSTDSGTDPRTEFQTTSDVQKKLGNPLSVQTPQKTSSTKVFVYKDQRFQVHHAKVEAIFQNPDKDQKQLQYWRHLWKEDRLESYVLEKSHNGEQSLVLKNRDRGISVIYSKNDGRVERVIYENP